MNLGEFKKGGETEEAVNVLRVQRTSAGLKSWHGIDPVGKRVGMAGAQVELSDRCRCHGLNVFPSSHIIGSTVPYL
jgi:hypothetical protein